MLTTCIAIYLSAAEAEAFCPACIFGAGVGVVEAVNSSNVWKMGIWLSLLLVSSCIYFMKKLSVERNVIYGAASGFAAAIVAMLFLRGVSVLFGIMDVQTSAILDNKLLYIGASLSGVVCAYLSSIISCIAKHYGYRIPFLQMMLVLTAGYVAAGFVN